MPGKGPPECADGPQDLLPRALCSGTIPATTFPRLQAAVRANRVPVTDNPRYRWRGEGAPGPGWRPGSSPALLGRPGQLPGVPSRPKRPAQPLRVVLTWVAPRRPGGLVRLFLCERHRFAPSNRPGPLTRPTRVQKDISGAFESCAVRERQVTVARPVSRRRAARPTGPPIARNCGARRHLPACGSEHQRPPTLQDARSLPIRAPGLATPTAQARMTRARGLHAIRSRIRSDNDTSSLPERRIERRFFLFRWHRAHTSDTGNVSPDSDLHRPVAWFPGAYDLRALSWALVRVWGAAGRGCHFTAEADIPNKARFT
jgi:hypothetical protein